MIPHASREGLNSEARVSQEASFSLLHTHIHTHTQSLKLPQGPLGQDSDREKIVAKYIFDEELYQECIKNSYNSIIVRQPNG